MTTILLIIILIMVLLYVILFSNNKKFKKNIITQVNELNSPLRKGYYKHGLVFDNKDKFDVIVYINEIERYTCGESKCELTSIDIENKPKLIKHDDVYKYIGEQFVSLIKTDNITWLEELTSLKEERKNKIEKLLNKIKNNKTEKI